MFGFQSNINNYTGGLVYKGTWDALNNVPFLQSGIGVGGEYYIVSIAGTTNLDGTTDWQVGDWAIFVIDTPDQWQKVDNHDIQSYTTIQEEGVNLTQESVLDFQGAGVTASNGAGKTIVTINGTPPTNSYGLFAQTADSTPVTATVVETTIVGPGVGTLSVPANGFSIGDSFQATLDGILSCVGTATLHIHVKTLTGVILADTGIIAMDAATSKSWLLTLYFTIRNIGTTTVASISSGGLFSYIKNSGTNFEGYVLSTVNNTTFDTTINNTLVITVQWNTTNAGNSILSRNFTLTKIY
jgi:hypothetical protein